MMPVRKWVCCVLAMIVAASVPATAFGQSELDYQKALEELFGRWNRKEPLDREIVKKALLPSLETRVRNRTVGYEDQEWLREVLGKIDSDVPQRITPKLAVAEDAKKQYIEYVTRVRLRSYGQNRQQFGPVLEPAEDLRPKAYLLLSIAEREATLVDRDSMIRFKHLRRAIFFWLTALFPLC